MLFIKRVPRECTESAEREIRALQRLDHPSIPKLYYVHRNSEGTEIGMTYFSGGTLGDMFRAGKYFSYLEIRDITLQLCEIIGYMHSEECGRLCHLDLHPDNLILSSGRICIVDFGNSRCEGESCDRTCGTPPFTAPELFDGRRADRRSDIFSLGTMIYWMLSASKIKEESPAEWECMRKIAALCTRELPEHRLQSAVALKKIIEMDRD